MQEPNTRVIRYEAKNHVPRSSDYPCIAPHWDRWHLASVAVVPVDTRRTRNQLGSVGLKMDRVTAGVVVVNDDFNKLTAFYNESIRIYAIDYRIFGCSANSHCCEQQRYFLNEKGHVIESRPTYT
jgi:hypothetical protein